MNTAWQPFNANSFYQPTSFWGYQNTSPLNWFTGNTYANTPWNGFVPTTPWSFFNPFSGQNFAQPPFSGTQGNTNGAYPFNGYAPSVGPNFANTNGRVQGQPGVNPVTGYAGPQVCRDAA